jgi:ribonuclease HII
MQNVKRASLTASLQFEEACWSAGCRIVIGVDEVGRGTWAGPVAAGAVYLPYNRHDLVTVLEGVRDSKQMTPHQRESLVERIKETAVAWGIGSATSAEIDAYGIVPATRLAMERALEATKLKADYLLLDSIKWLDSKTPFQSIVRGDTLSLSIASASVLAKVWRDDYMRHLDEKYPAYHFAQHKGYGTAKHSEALHQHGACDEHRLSFAPLRHLAVEITS